MARQEEAFRTKIHQWLTPLGYTTIWAENHPQILKDEVHYTIGKFRIVCVKDRQEEYFYLIYEFPFEGFYYAVKSRKHGIGKDIIKPFEEFTRLTAFLPKRGKKISFIKKIKLLFFKK